MNTDVNIQTRDNLFNYLREHGIKTWGVGLTRNTTGVEHLLVITDNANNVPSEFEGLPVSVVVAEKATAQ